MHAYFRSRFVAWALIVVAGSIAYANSFDVPFLFDDEPNITWNEHIRMETLSPAAVWNAAARGRTLRPLANLSFALNYYLGGEQVWGYHLVNLCVHLLCGLVVFELTRVLLAELHVTLGRDGPSSAMDAPGDRLHWIAVVAALLFVVHPVQTQSVTYIVQRMASMCALFYLGGVLAFLVGRRANSQSARWTWWIVALGLWGLSLGTKENAVTFPLAIFLVEWIVFRGGERSWLFKQTKILVALATLLMVIAFLFKGRELPLLFTRGYTKRDFTLVERLLTEGRVIVHYLSLILLPLPSRMALIYDFPISTGVFSPITTVLSWGGIFAAIAWSFANAHRYRLLAFCVLWFFLHLAVESTVIPLELVYEHRLYLPLFSACLLMATCFIAWPRQIGVGLAVAGVVAMLLGVTTYRRNEDWRTVEGFWTDNITKHPAEPRGYGALGVHYERAGEFDEAMKWYERTLELEPRFYMAHLQRGQLLHRQGDVAGALAAYNDALAIPIVESQGPGDHSVAHVLRGAIYSRQGKLDLAHDDLTKAIEIERSYARAYFERALVRARQKNPAGAINDFLGAMHFDPSMVDAHDKFAWYIATQPDPKFQNNELAIKHATIACEMTDWSDFAKLSTLAAAHARAGQFERAREVQQKSMELAPENRKAAMTERLRMFDASTPITETY